jgi:nitrate reductase alpha subunit
MDQGIILKQINGEIEDFKSKQVQIVPGLTFNQYDILNRTYFYYNSKFSQSGGVMDQTEIPAKFSPRQ